MDRQQPSLCDSEKICYYRENLKLAKQTFKIDNLPSYTHRNLSARPGGFMRRWLEQTLPFDLSQKVKFSLVC